MSASPFHLSPQYSQFIVFGSSRGPLTAADLFNDTTQKVNEKPCRSGDGTELPLPWPLPSQGLKDRQTFVLFYERMSVCACAQDLPTLRPFPSFYSSSPTSPPSPCRGRNSHIGRKVYTPISSEHTLPEKPHLPVWVPTSSPFLNELHAPAGDHHKEREGSQSSRGRHTDSWKRLIEKVWAEQKKQKNKCTICWTWRSAWYLRTIFKNAWRDWWISMKGFDKRRMDTLFYLCSLLVFFPVSLPLFGHSVRKIYVRIIWCPSEEGHCVTTPTPAFDIPESRSSAIIPYFLFQEQSSCGTFTWSDGYYPPRSSHLQRDPLIPELLQKRRMVTRRLHLSL